jgi:1-acyl-sn-glycerol-3-phosphate acyltransferase
MLKPKQNKLISGFFSWYVDKIIKKDFKEYCYNSVEINKNKAVLVLCNHFSWWDGFLIFQLNRLFIKKKFYVMISEENYKKVGFLKYMGAFSISKNSKDVITSLKFAAELLNNPQNLLLIFPQGRLHSNHVPEVEFEKGLAKVIAYSNKNFQYVFVSMFSDYFRHRKPIITAYLQQRDCTENESIAEISQAYNLHYKHSLNKQTAPVL